jgi:hypothetical protein
MLKGLNRQFRLFVVGATGLLSALGFAAAPPDAELRFLRIAEGASSGVLEVVVDGKAVGVLYRGESFSELVDAGPHDVLVRLLRREGGREVYGVQPIAQTLEVGPGQLRELRFSVVPEAMGLVLEVEVAR